MGGRRGGQGCDAARMGGGLGARRPGAEGGRLAQVDREGSTAERCSAVESDIFDLFASLGATEEQLDFPVLYASARQGWAATALPPPGRAPEGGSLAPLLDVILGHVPAPAGMGWEVAHTSRSAQI